MILIMKILLHNEYKIINLWYPTYVNQFFNFPYNYKNRVLACFQIRPAEANTNTISLCNSEMLKLSVFWLPIIIFSNSPGIANISVVLRV